MATFVPNQNLTASQLNALFDKIMADPTTTGLAGTATATINVEVRDDVLGTYPFTAASSRRYRAMLTGLKLSGTVGTLVVVRIRDGGALAPTTASTIVAESSVYIPATGGPGQVGCFVSGTFTPSSGTRTLAAFTVVTAVGNAVATPVGTRELYVEDIGAA